MSEAQGSRRTERNLLHHVLFLTAFLAASMAGPASAQDDARALQARANDRVDRYGDGRLCTWLILPSRIQCHTAAIGEEAVQPLREHLLAALGVAGMERSRSPVRKRGVQRMDFAPSPTDSRRALEEASWRLLPGPIVRVLLS